MLVGPPPPSCPCSYGKPDASFEEIAEAARAAHADEFVEQLPQVGWVGGWVASWEAADSACLCRMRPLLDQCWSNGP